jgi:predicted ribosome quality control (RQC) complex YloA/Tae2 family protein
VDECQADCFRYELGDGWVVLAGKSDRDNDLLSTRVARADDTWFHVKGMPGSHVLLRGPAGERPDRALLRQAAAIAAYHSKARDGGRTAVVYTLAKFVGKKPGSPPGTVTHRRGRTLTVRPQRPE